MTMTSGEHVLAVGAGGLVAVATAPIWAPAAAGTLALIGLGGVAAATAGALGVTATTAGTFLGGGALTHYVLKWTGKLPPAAPAAPAAK